MRTWFPLLLAACTSPSDEDALRDTADLQANGTQKGDCEGMPLETYYADGDSDGFGDPSVTVEHCEQPEGFVDNALDCDDGRPKMHPDAEEVCDGLDNDCDDKTDEDLGEKWVWTDGTTKEVIFFDTSGLKIEWRWNQNGKGGPDRVHTFSYDEYDQMIRAYHDDDNDGTTDLAMNWSYDERGNMLTAVTDETGGGVISTQHTYTWSDDDQLLKTVYRELRPAGLRVIWRTGLEYDDDGNIITQWSDHEGNPDWDSVTRFEYNAQNQETRRESDTDNDGVLETWTDTLYNASNRVSRTETRTLGYDITTRFTYDSSNRLQTEKIDIFDDGTNDTVITHSWMANGRTETVETDHGNDGTINTRTRTTVDGRGRLIKVRIDVDGDDTYDLTTWNEYHKSSQQLTRVATDTDGDGFEDQVMTQTFDADNRLTGTEWDDDGDDSIDRYWTAEVSCDRP